MDDHLAAIKAARSGSELEKACFRATRAGCDRAAVSAARDVAATALADSDPRKHAQLVVDRGVFLGPFSVAWDVNELRRLGVTHIVCLSAEGKCDIPGVVYEEHALVEVDCTLERGIEQLLACLPSCVAFVRNAVAADQKVLSTATTAAPVARLSLPACALSSMVRTMTRRIKRCSERASTCMYPRRGILHFVAPSQNCNSRRINRCRDGASPPCR